MDLPTHRHRPKRPQQLVSSSKTTLPRLRQFVRQSTEVIFEPDSLRRIFLLRESLRKFENSARQIKSDLVSDQFLKIAGIYEFGHTSLTDYRLPLTTDLLITRLLRSLLRLKTAQQSSYPQNQNENGPLPILSRAWRVLIGLYLLRKT